MILSALTQYYERLITTSNGAVPSFGFSEEKIGYILVLSERGELVDLVPNLSEEKKPKPRLLNVPRPEKRTSGIKPNFLWDKTAYVLGVGLPKDKKRGATYILVYRINKSKEAIVQITPGYFYKKDQKVGVTIDNTQFDFYSDDDAAFTNDDNKVIFAMKKGIKLTVKGESSLGTKTTDTYTLKGFTAGYNQLFNDC